MKFEQYLVACQFAKKVFYIASDVGKKKSSRFSALICLGIVLENRITILTKNLSK